MMHRPNREGERGRRELFTNAGYPLEKHEAYRMIDEAGRGTKFVRIVISPDPLYEDTHRDLDMRGLTEATIAALERRLRRPVRFIATLHDDHTDKRHVHLIALVNRPLGRRDFRALIRTATFEARKERQMLDRAKGVEITRTKTSKRVVVTAKRRSMRLSGGAVAKQDLQAPVCPKAGLAGHPVIAIKPGFYWCRTCREGIKERQIKLEISQSDLELELT